MTEGLTELRTRQEELWWDAPRIRYMRERVLESVNRDVDWCAKGEDAYHNHIVFTGWHTMSPIPSCIQIMFFVPKWGGWVTRPFFTLGRDIFNLKTWWRWGPAGSVKLSDYHLPSDHGLYKHGGVDQSKLVDCITGPDDPTLTALDRMVYVSRDPRLMDSAEFEQGDDSVKAHRLLCLAIDRLLKEEPEVPSIWREDGQLKVGWDPLPPEDGRLPRQVVPMMANTKWLGTSKQDLHEWRWRAGRADLRYDGAQQGY